MKILKTKEIIDINKEDFLDIVFVVMSKNPKWFGEVNLEMQRGIMARLEVEKGLRADAETAVSILAGSLDQVPNHQKEIVAKVIINSGMFKGTRYAAQIKEKYLSSF